MARNNRKIERTLREIEKQLMAMGTLPLDLSVRELEEEREFDCLLDIKEKYHKNKGTLDWEYDTDPNEL